ncbi:MAG TPA: hypothetical protein VF177_11250 [Anaerolineae bacterium]
MATDLETSVRNAAQKLANALEQASMLTVETKWVEVGDQGAVNWDDARPVSRTIIKLDGDTDLTIPMTRSEAGALERDVDLLELHMRNVTSAIEYRASLLDALLTAIRQSRTR